MNKKKKHSVVVSDKGVIDFIKNNAKIVTTDKGESYYFLPYWFSEINSYPYQGLDAHSLGNLPQELTETIKAERQGEQLLKKESRCMRCDIPTRTFELHHNGGFCTKCRIDVSLAKDHKDESL